MRLPVPISPVIGNDGVYPLLAPSLDSVPRFWREQAQLIEGQAKQMQKMISAYS